MVYVIEHQKGLVVVDTGLPPQLAHDKHRLRGLAASFAPYLSEDGENALGPTLSRFGFDAHAVTHAVLTHLHFDHAGGLCELPNAAVVVQAREWAQLADARLVARGAINPDDVELGHDRTPSMARTCCAETAAIYVAR